MGAPVWLPLAYARARFDGSYVLLLLVLPAIVTALALWFFYETAVARLSSESDNRTTGLKRWYLVSLPLVGAIAAVPGWMTRGPSRLGAFMGGLAACSCSSPSARSSSSATLSALLGEPSFVGRSEERGG